MDLKLHANATTTPRIRAYIQKSTASNSALARELGIHSRTVARWKTRPDVVDRSTRPHRLATTISPWEEVLILELRRSLALPLDDILEAMRRCVNPKLSRSGIHRCLQRHSLSARLTPQQAPATAFHTDAPAGFIHIDVKYLPPLGRRRSYAYVAPFGGYYHHDAGHSYGGLPGHVHAGTVHSGPSGHAGHAQGGHGHRH